MDFVSLKLLLSLSLLVSMINFHDASASKKASNKELEIDEIQLIIKYGDKITQFTLRKSERTPYLIYSSSNQSSLKYDIQIKDVLDMYKMVLSLKKENSASFNTCHRKIIKLSIKLKNKKNIIYNSCLNATSNIGRKLRKISSTFTILLARAKPSKT